MTKLRCPFCKEEIISDMCFIFNKENRDYTDGRQIYKCNKCGLFGNKKLVQALIDTKKKLDIAVDALKEYANTEHWDFEHFYNINTYDIAQEALEQIKY